MTKPATNIASAAKPSAIAVRTSTPSSRSEMVACASSSDVRTVLPGSAAATRSRSTSGLTPSSAATSSVSGPPPSLSWTSSQPSIVPAVTRPEPLAPIEDASPPGVIPTTRSGCSTSGGMPSPSTWEKS